MGEMTEGKFRLTESYHGWCLEKYYFNHSFGSLLFPKWIKPEKIWFHLRFALEYKDLSVLSDIELQFDTPMYTLDYAMTYAEAKRHVEYMIDREKLVEEEQQRRKAFAQSSVYPPLPEQAPER